MLRKSRFFAAPLILILMFVLLISSSLSESRAYDEITHVNSGYQFIVNQDFRYDPFNPPLAREIIAIPTVLNKSLIDDPILFWPRLMVIFFTLSLGVIVYLFAKSLFGWSSGLLALLIFSLEPNILANGHYAETDLIFTFFYILCFYVYYLWRKKFTNRKIIIFGALIGFLLSCKTTALLFFFLPIALIFIHDQGFKKVSSIKYLKTNFHRTLMLVICCIFFLWATYFFKFEPMLGNRFDPNRAAINIAKNNKLVKFALYQPVPLGGYISTIKEQIVFNYSGLYRRDSMILGNISNNGQSGLYFIPLILIKIPWEILTVFIITFYLYRKKTTKSLIILIPLFCILTEILFINAIIAIRYILPVIPLIVIYSSQIMNLKNRFKYIALGAMLVLLMAESFSAFPHYISYVNLSLGGYKNGYKYVFDSNYDWGQGLIDLRKYQIKNNVSRLNLAYFGDINPSEFNLKYTKIYDNVANYNYYKFPKIQIEKKSVYAISTTCWYLCGYNKQPEFSSQKITEVVGGSILIFKE